MTVEASKITVTSTPNGFIDLLFLRGGILVLQFNGPCKEMLPFCHAMCCRNRSVVNVELDAAEVPVFQTKQVVDTSGKVLNVLQGTKDDSCVYLDDENLCTVHGQKPRMCRDWHCSPKGKDENGELVKIRDGGWFLSPMGSLLRTIEQETANAS